MITPAQELDFDHEVVCSEPLRLGDEIKGMAPGAMNPWVGKVVFVGQGDAIVELYSAAFPIYPEDYKAGDKIRFVWGE